MIVRSRVVVPIVGEPIENGAIAIDGNEITDVGRFEAVKTSHGGDVLDLGEQIVLPGLINAHCHLDYTSLRGQIPPPSSFTDWIRAINARKAALSQEDYVASINAGFAEVQKFGTTTILNLEAFPDLLPRTAGPSPLRVWWCSEVIDVRERASVQETFGNLLSWFQSNEKRHGGVGLAPHAPYTASAKLYAAAAKIARKQSVPLTTHVAESREEMQMFRDASGHLFDFLKSIGRPMDDCGGGTPLSALMQGSAVDERWIIAHLNELTDGDFDLLASAKRFHVVHCPRSHTYFGHAPIALQRLRALGFNICLGTDSLASNSDLSLFAEMRELLRKEPEISPREVLAMATRNGAQAVGQANPLGQISPGSRADLIAIPSGAAARNVFETIVAFEGEVRWMMVNGEILDPRWY